MQKYFQMVVTRSKKRSKLVTSAGETASKLLSKAPNNAKELRSPQSTHLPKPDHVSSSTDQRTNTNLTEQVVVAAINPDYPYQDLKVSPAELRPSATLTTGQSFVWQVVKSSTGSAPSTPTLKTTAHIDNNHTTEATPELPSPTVSAWGSHNATEWIGIIRAAPDHSVVVAIRETPTTTLYRPLTKTNCDLEQVLRKYFQLDISLEELYREWSDADPRLATIAKCLPGVRILDQDPWECLVSFICSSNNNIPRITKMVSAIRREYGQPLVEINGETLYSFPSANDLRIKATDQDLRQKCGMGYRSKYLLETLNILHKHGGESYLHHLRQLSSSAADEVQAKLCEFCGVGRKVADCVALFSLQQDSAIPVDTHVWNIARRDYDKNNQLANVKSLTPATYKLVGDLFRDRFPRMAGWAHSLLFVAELPSFRPVLPDSMIKDMDDFRMEEARRKQRRPKRKREGDTEG